MARTDKLGSARRFGARYGRTVKHRLAKIEKEQRKKHKCPYCLKSSVKRVFAGVWTCNACGTKFTSRAYTVTKIKLTRQKDKITEIKDEQTSQEELEMEA